MSVLTHATLYVDYPDEAFRKAATQPVDESGQCFAELDTDAAGGHKVFCGTILAACFNHVIPEDVEAFVAALPWAHQSGALVIAWEHDDGVSLVKRFGREPDPEGWRY